MLDDEKRINRGSDDNHQDVVESWSPPRPLSGFGSLSIRRRHRCDCGERGVGGKDTTPSLTISYNTAVLEMATLSPAEAEAQVSSWGFKHVFTWTDRP